MGRVSRRRVSRRRRTSRRKVVRRRRKARKVSTRGSKVQVFRGSRLKTKSSGQTKSDLMKNKRGRIVSKKAHAKGKRIFKKNGLDKWVKAFMHAKKEPNSTKKPKDFTKNKFKIYLSPHKNKKKY